MISIKNSVLGFGVAIALSGALTAVTLAEAQSGRVKARGEKGSVAAAKGPNGGGFGRAAGCTQNGGVQCGSGLGVSGVNGNYAGRAGVSQYGQDGSFNRDAGAYAVTQYGQSGRSVSTLRDPNGAGQRSVDGFATTQNGLAERNSLLTVDENGNAARSGSAFAQGAFGSASTGGVGSYSQESGLDFNRGGQLDVVVDRGEANAERNRSYNQDTGYMMDYAAGGSFAGENGSIQGGANSSYTRDDGYAYDGAMTATNAQGGTVDANASYNAQDGRDANVTCTNAQGEIVSCKN